MVRQELQVFVSQRLAVWGVYGLASPEGEEMANFYEVWMGIASCLGIRPGLAKYKATAKM